MKRVLFLIVLILPFACKKAKKPSNDASYKGMDLSEVLETDDFFKSKKRSSSSAKDSIERQTVELGDINNDGFKDSAIIEYNNLTSIYKIKFSCVKETISQSNVSQLSIKDIGDLNNDGFHEIMLFLQSEESCWDEIKLYSYIDKWVEKYNGLTYQCTDNNNYQFRKLNDKTVQLTTYGINKDSIDMISGDTLENIIPNAPNSNIISW